MHIDTILKAIAPALLCACALPCAALTVTSSPGGLAAALGAEARSATSLKVEGALDARDFETLRDSLPSLRSLDLTGARIAAYAPARPKGTFQSEYAAEALPAGALLGSPIETLLLPSTLKQMGAGALSGCAVKELRLPASLATMEPYALAGCTSLQSLDMGACALQTLSTGALHGCTALRELTLPAGLKEIGEGALSDCTSLRSLSIPSSVTRIGERALAGSGLERISLPASVATLEPFALTGCSSLKSASIAGGAPGRGALMDCPALQEVALPASLDTLEPYALKGTGVQRVALPGSVTALGDGAMAQMPALKTIDVSALDSQIPALGKDVWEGVDPSDVKLAVKPGTEAAWKAADGWREFNILTTSAESLQADVTARLEGDLLLVSAPQEILLLTAADESGLSTARIAPHALQATLDVSALAGEVLIVTVRYEDGSRTFKLARR